MKCHILIAWPRFNKSGLISWSFLSTSSTTIFVEIFVNFFLFSYLCMCPHVPSYSHHFGLTTAIHLNSPIVIVIVLSTYTQVGQHLIGPPVDGPTLQLWHSPSIIEGRPWVSPSVFYPISGKVASKSLFLLLLNIVLL